MTPQVPDQWPSVAKAAKIALTFRYYYLPYLYSFHYRASLLGGTVIRPLFFEFPNETASHDVNEQFMWGECLMIAPAVKVNILNVEAYFPQASWYSLGTETYGILIPPGMNSVSAKKDTLIPADDHSTTSAEQHIHRLSGESDRVVDLMTVRNSGTNCFGIMETMWLMISTTIQDIIGNSDIRRPAADATLIGECNQCSAVRRTALQCL